MSEEKKEEEGKVPEEVEIGIKFNPKTGNIAIRGVIKNEIIALYMLEKAKDMVKALNMPRPSSIIKPKGSIMDFVRRGKK